MKSNRLFAWTRTLACALSAQACLFAPVFAAEDAPSPIEILSTRVIYNEGTPSTTLSVRNNDRISYLAALAVEPFVGVNAKAEATTEDFMTSPAIRILRPGETYPFRIVRLAENLPQDVESLYVAALRIIPSEEGLTEKELDGNRVILSLSGHLKFFYRPAALANTFGVEELRLTVDARCDGANVVVHNPSPYWGTFASLRFDSVDALKDGPKPMIAPKSDASFPVSACPRTVFVSFISENGIETPIREIPLEDAGS